MSSFQPNWLSIMMPRAEPKEFLYVLEKHFPLDLLSLLVCFIFPPVYLYIKRFIPNNPAFQQQIIFANDEKFWLKYLPVLLLGMSCTASAKSSMVSFQREKEMHRYTGEAVSCD